MNEHPVGYVIKFGYLIPSTNIPSGYNIMVILIHRRPGNDNPNHLTWYHVLPPWYLGCDSCFLSFRAVNLLVWRTWRSKEGHSWTKWYLHCTLHVHIICWMCLDSIQCATPQQINHLLSRLYVTGHRRRSRPGLSGGAHVGAMD